MRIGVAARAAVEVDHAPADEDGDVPVFEAEAPRSRSQTRRTPVMDERQRSSLEIGEDEIDIPSFLKD